MLLGDAAASTAEVSGEGASSGVEAALCSRDLIEAWLEATQAEIIVLVEGIDSTTSYTIQARHSYTCVRCTAAVIAIAITITTSKAGSVGGPGGS